MCYKKNIVVFLLGISCGFSSLKAEEQKPLDKTKEETEIKVESAKDAGSMTISFDVVKGSGPTPMFVMWLETRKGLYKTVKMFSKHSEYYADMTVWYKKLIKAKGSFKNTKALRKEIDAVVGATVKWEGHGEVTVPFIQNEEDIRNGKYRLRVEQRKDGGGHYNSIKIKLNDTFKGGVLKDKGYIKKMKISLNKKEEKTQEKDKKEKEEKK